MNKDWKGNSVSYSKIGGFSSHSDEEREINDYYATHSSATEWLISLEKLDKFILEPACVDKETEFFNGYSWKKINLYNKDDKVLCYDKNGYGILEKPIEYVKIENEKPFYVIDNKNLNMCLTLDHNLIYKNYKNILLKDSLKNILYTFEKDSNGFRGKIPISFEYEGDLDLNEWLLRLSIAVNADGRIRSKTNYSEVRFTKDRKYERLKFLLEKANISYKYFYKQEYHYFYFYSPLGCKIFPQEWYKLNKKCKSIIIDEVKYWDGTISKDNYSTFYFTSKKSDLDFIQFCANSIGISTTISKDSRRNTINYRLSFINKKHSSIKKQKN